MARHDPRGGVTVLAPYVLLVPACAGCVPYIVNCRAPLAASTDLGGRRVRSSHVTGPFLASVGAIAVPMPGGDIPNALRQGRIDCALGGGLIP